MAVWFTLIGVLFVGMALVRTHLRHMPVTTALVYLGVGAVLGALGLVEGTPWGASEVLEVGAEIAVIVSLFTAGLKLRAPLTEKRWVLPVRLAFLSMTLTVAAIAAFGVYALGLPLGVAVLLGAVLAPTDPVLASDVQVRHPDDCDRLRFSLTGEAGLNDGTAFPFVMLGLGLIGAHEIGAWGLRWLGVDVLWAIGGGLALGWGCGLVIGRLVLHLRKIHREALGLDDFLTLGLIALSYGGALLLHTYGFLAVFAAGLALRRVERQGSGEQPLRDVKAAAEAERATEEPDEDVAEILEEEGVSASAVDEQRAAAYMADAVLGFNEQLERIGELAVVVITGALLVQTPLPIELLGLAAVLFFVIRPAAVWLGLAGADVTNQQRRYISWFGIRGIGSLYYLAYALNHGLGDLPEAEFVASLTVGVMALSIVLHGISVTPLMDRYRKTTEEG